MLAAKEKTGSLAIVPSQARTRVWGASGFPPNGIGASSDLNPISRLGCSHAYDEIASARLVYPNWPSDDPKVMGTALYFDPVNFVPRIHAPVLAAIGFIDTTSPPAGVWTVINQVPGPTEVIGMVESDHNNRTPQKQGDWASRSKEVLDLLLHGGDFKPVEESRK